MRLHNNLEFPKDATEFIFGRASGRQLCIDSLKEVLHVYSGCIWKRQDELRYAVTLRAEENSIFLTLRKVSQTINALPGILMYFWVPGACPPANQDL